MTEYAEYFVSLLNDDDFGTLLSCNKKIYDSLKEWSSFKTYLDGLFGNGDWIQEDEDEDDKKLVKWVDDNVISFQHYPKEHICETIYGYTMPDGWRHKLIDELATNEDIGNIERYIGEFGLRRAWKMVKDSDYFYDNLPDISTDLGFRQIFYVMLDEIIQLGDNVKQVDTLEEFNFIDWGKCDEDDKEGVRMEKYKVKFNLRQ